jgi:hypothetical protein
LHTTTQRLGEAAASTNSYAAHGFSISHDKFMRVTAAVAPNRKLSAAHLSKKHEFFVLSYKFIARYVAGTLSRCLMIWSYGCFQRFFTKIFRNF